MKDLFINSSFNFINKNKTLDHREKLKIRYGLEVLYHFITKTSMILLIAFIFNSLKVVLLFNVFYLLLRSTAHGFHAKNNIECWIITIFMYSFIIVFNRFIVFDKISILIMTVLSFISFLIWSPADTKYLPLIRKKDRIRLKKISLILLAFESILLHFYFTNIILSSIILETINVNPIIYKIFGMDYKNYANYQ